jgi:hypothetical protein
VPSNFVFAHSLVVFPFDDFATFSILQASFHEIWVRFYSGSRKDDIQYAPTDCFETFPLPTSYRENRKLYEVGDAFFNKRAKVMLDKSIGLTEVHNRIHDPGCFEAEIIELREALSKLDATVLSAYNWSDLILEYAHLPSFTEEDEDEIENEGNLGQVAATKIHYRYRLLDSLHDEILSRLLAFNQQQAREQCMLLDTTGPDAANNANDEESKPKKPLPKPNGKGKQQKSVIDLPLFQ